MARWQTFVRSLVEKHSSSAQPAVRDFLTREFVGWVSRPVRPILAGWFHERHALVSGHCLITGLGASDYASDYASGALRFLASTEPRAMPLVMSVPTGRRCVAQDVPYRECYRSFRLARAAIASSAAEIQKRTTIFISWCPLKR